MQPPRKRVLPNLHFVASNFGWPERAAIDHDGGKPDMPPIDFVSASKYSGGTNFRCGHGTSPGVAKSRSGTGEKFHCAITLKPERWLSGRRSGGERIAAFAMKHIQPFRSRLLDTVPIHYLLAFRAIGVGNYR